MKTHTFTNKLVHEKSPYLLQHAHNPVDWYPWGEEAFEKAEKENKPIFLSIGYSTCHWCHVMEKESFENEEIAKVLNEHYVSVKVDREERPDIDNVYMQAVMAMTGAGGWPMSVFLTPDKKPFYGGTYFPPEDKWGRPGFITVLNGIAQKWQSAEREKIEKTGDYLTEKLQEEAAKGGQNPSDLNLQTLQKTYEQLEGQFDFYEGGFGQAPKFPRSHVLSFLLRSWKRDQNERALQMVEQTLDVMARGGMYDHLGGGFHRYSTDRKWHVPHFEKMLYDQAILVRTYLEAYQVTGNERYADVVRDTLNYVSRDMMDAKGGFYSAEDADSAEDASLPDEKKEGAFFVWKASEVETVLGLDDAKIFNYYFDVKKDGNAEEDPHQEFVGKNILHIIHTIGETAKEFDQTEKAIAQVLSAAKQKLYKERLKRPKPHLDDKVLTDWNGLMISSFAFASRVLQNPSYAQNARDAADFILNEMVNDEGRLMHRYREGETAIPGFIEDYAFFILGLLDLYEATFDIKYLEEAQRLTKEMVALFWDDENGGFFFVGSDSKKLITRIKEIYDGAIPSGNSVAALVLVKVARLTMDRELEPYIENLFRAFSSSLEKSPAAYPQMMIAFDFFLGPSREIVVAGDEQDSSLRQVWNTIFEAFIPNKVVVFHPSSEEQASRIQKIAPFLEKQTAMDDQPTIYICRNYQCDLPITDVKKLEDALAR